MGSSTRKVNLGSWGEEQAQAYLESAGMKLLVRNFHTFVGEIDLVMEDQGCVVFVEVKTRSSKRFGTPEESITRAKKQRIYKAALAYLEREQWLDREWRVDIVAVECHIPLVIDRIDHYPNIVMDVV